MKAIQTTLLDIGCTFGPRIEATAGDEHIRCVLKKGLTVEENHRLVAEKLATKLDWLRGGLELVTGSLGDESYVHTFGPARDGSDCSMCGAYAPTRDGMVSDSDFYCSDCVHDNDMRTDVDFGNAEQDRDIAIVALRLMLDKYGQEGDESFVAKQVLGFLEEKNNWLDADGARDLKLALVEVLDGMDCDDMLDRLLDRLGFSVEKFDDEVPALHVVETEGGE